MDLQKIPEALEIRSSLEEEFAEDSWDLVYTLGKYPFLLCM